MEGNRARPLHGSACVLLVLAAGMFPLPWFWRKVGTSQPDDPRCLGALKPVFHRQVASGCYCGLRWLLSGLCPLTPTRELCRGPN